MSIIIRDAPLLLVVLIVVGRGRRMSRTEAVTVALTSEEKDRWKLALACTGYPNLSAFVRESMEQICEMILSVGEIEELEVVFMLQPRSDGIKTEKMDRNLGVRCENGWQRLQ